MPKLSKTINPFYTVLVISGVAFGITALAYGVMSAIGKMDPVKAMDDIEAGRGLVALMHNHGVTLIAIELAVLAVATVLAIGTDGFWTRRAEAKQDAKESPDKPATT